MKVINNKEISVTQQGLFTWFCHSVFAAKTAVIYSSFGFERTRLNYQNMSFPYSKSWHSVSSERCVFCINVTKFFSSYHDTLLPNFRQQFLLIFKKSHHYCLFLLLYSSRLLHWYSQKNMLFRNNIFIGLTKKRRLFYPPSCHMEKLILPYKITNALVITLTSNVSVLLLRSITPRHFGYGIRA